MNRNEKKTWQNNRKDREMESACNALENSRSVLKTYFIVSESSEFFTNNLSFKCKKLSISVAELFNGIWEFSYFLRVIL